MEENAKINTIKVRFKVASYALTSAIKALNNCGIYDIYVSKEDNELVVVYDELEPSRYPKMVYEDSGSSYNDKCSASKY